jgi:biopolymer transport protein ExbD
MSTKKIVLIVLIAVVSIIGLLALFFNVTSQYTTATDLKLIRPKGEDQISLDTFKNKLTLILINDNTIYAYKQNQMQSGRFYNTESIKKEISDNKEIAIVIKPSAKTSYQFTVDMLDQMTINDVKKYAMVDLSKEEQKFIDQSN